MHDVVLWDKPSSVGGHAKLKFQFDWNDLQCLLFIRHTISYFFESCKHEPFECLRKHQLGKFHDLFIIHFPSTYTEKNRMCQWNIHARSKLSLETPEHDRPFKNHPTWYRRKYCLQLQSGFSRLSGIRLKCRMRDITMYFYYSTPPWTKTVDISLLPKEGKQCPKSWRNNSLSHPIPHTNIYTQTASRLINLQSVLLLAPESSLQDNCIRTPFGGTASCGGGCETGHRSSRNCSDMLRLHLSIAVPGRMLLHQHNGQ